MDNLKRSYNSSKSNVGKYKSDKVKEVNKSSGSRQKGFELHVSDQDTTPISFPIIKQADISETLPKYTTVLSRSQEDGVGMEDLDEIQQDFETLLSICSVRHRLLRSEVESIDRVEEKKEKKGKPYDKPSIKKKRVEEKPKYKNSRNVARIIKTKHTVPVNNFNSDLTVRYELPKVIIPKYDVSDRFWVSIDPYCSDIGKDDVCFLDDLLKECSQEIDVKIPEIGEHYALEWSENAVQSEQNNGSIKGAKKSNTTYSNEVKKNGINNSVMDTFTSPLTQRLLDSLIEEKVMKNIPTVYEKLKSSDFTLKATNGMRGGGVCLDRRLRKELVEQGILDMEDLPKTFPPEDEILLEIKKSQQELAIVNKQNITDLNKLRTVIARDLRRQEVKAALDKVDTQVLNMYNKIVIARMTHGVELAENVYDKHMLPKPDLTEFEDESTNIIKQQLVLHRELTDLTDFSLLE